MKIEPCKDDPSAQCELYNAAALCDPNGVYFGWALSRCPDHCGLCPATTTPLISTVTSLQSSYPFSLFQCAKILWTVEFIMRPRFVSPMGSILSGPNKTVQRIVHIAKLPPESFPAVIN